MIKQSNIDKSRISKIPSTFLPHVQIICFSMVLMLNPFLLELTAQTTSELNQSFIKAIANRNLNEVTELISSGFDVNMKIDSGATPLFTATMTDNLKIAELLINSGSDINTIDQYGWNVLIAASELGSYDMVKLFITSGVDVNIKNKDGNTALMLSSMNGHLDISKYLISNGSNVNEKNHDSWTALQIASQVGHNEIVKELIINGADVKSRNNNGNTALITASVNGHIGLMNELISQGADVNLKNNNGWTALMAASLNGHTEGVNYLISEGAEVNDIDNKGFTALMAASFKGHYKTVKTLINNGADINTTNNLGINAAMLASKKYHRDIVKSLNGQQRPTLKEVEDMEKVIISDILENGTSDRLVILKVSTSSGYPCSLTFSDAGGGFWYAAMELPSDKTHINNNDVAIYGNKSIHRFNGEVKFKDHNLPTFFGLGSIENRLTFLLVRDIGYIYIRGYGKVVFPDNEIVELGRILWYDDAIDSGNNDYSEYINNHISERFKLKPKELDSLLIDAAMIGDLDKVLRFISIGANVNAKNQDDENPLMKAAKIGHVDISKVLLENGADAINIQSNGRLTPLIVASDYGHIEVVKVLLASGVDPNFQNSGGRSALHFASINHSEVVEELLANGAKVNLKDDSGDTALHIASSWLGGNIEAVKLLLNNGADVTIQNNRGETALAAAIREKYNEIIELLKRAK